MEDLGRVAVNTKQAFNLKLQVRMMKIIKAMEQVVKILTQKILKSQKIVIWRNTILNGTPVFRLCMKGMHYSRTIM